MADNIVPPDDLMDAVKYIQEAKTKKFLSREERENLNRAKLRIAYWVCRSEGIVASRNNLEYVMGSDAIEIMRAYDKYLSSEPGDKDADKRQKKDGGKFWGGL